MKENLIDIEPKHLVLLKKILKQYIPAKTVWAYGSRVTWTAGIKSDLDIVVFDADSNKINDLKEAFAESDLPFSVDVMDWGNIPEKFKDNIRKKYVVLQEKVGVDGWKKCRLGEVAEVQTGPFGSQLHASDYIANGIPSIMPTNIGDRLKIDRDNIASIKDEDAQRLKKYLVEEGDVVYSRRGDVEKCAYITNQEKGWLCGTGCLRIRFDRQ